MKRIFLPILLSLLLSACGQNYIYEKSLSLPADTWQYDNVLEFAFDIKDTEALYNLYLEVAHGTTFQTQNVYVKFYTTSPDGKITEDLVSLELADKNGIWYGNCGGEICELLIPIQSNAYFEQTGKYTVKIEQYSREKKLPSVRTIGFKIEQTDKKRQ